MHEILTPLRSFSESLGDRVEQIDTSRWLQVVVFKKMYQHLHHYLAITKVDLDSEEKKRLSATKRHFSKKRLKVSVADILLASLRLSLSEVSCTDDAKAYLLHSLYYSSICIVLQRFILHLQTLPQQYLQNNNHQISFIKIH